ncbi:MAG: hypothetical protein KDA61_17650, partial [Planctomycetales bacterium]|nr:hypothetical protein [Planctomycetales bacterium]
MRRRRCAWAAFHAAIAVAPLAEAPVRAAEFIWDGATNLSGWAATVQTASGDLQNNWGRTGSSPPAPGAADSAIFPIDATTTGAATVAGLHNFATLTYGQGILAVSGPVLENSNTIIFAGDGAGQIFGYDDVLAYPAATTLFGGGTLSMVEINESRLTGSGALTNADNIIRGQGLIDVASFVNQATLRAEGGELWVESVVDNSAGEIIVASD